jgi:hypothetical protein
MALIRALHLANENKRDAEVGFSSAGRARPVRMVLPDGSEQASVKFLKTAADVDALVAEHGDLRAVGEAIIAGDPETDVELVGKFLPRTHKLYLKADGDIAYRVRMVQVRHGPDGAEVDRKDAAKAPANIAAELPVQWTGRRFPKSDAIRRFVFTRAYQLRHSNGLTYDFLYAMAKDLAESDALMMVGAGKKGNERLVITNGGDPYFAFLEGRVDGDKYCLILHLTNLELKALPKEAGDE